MMFRAFIFVAIFLGAPAAAQDQLTDEQKAAAALEAREAAELRIEEDMVTMTSLVEALSKNLGQIHYLRTLCFGDNDQKWREYASRMVQVEAPNDADRRRQLIRAFNAGYYQEQNRHNKLASMSRPLPKMDGISPPCSAIPIGKDKMVWFRIIGSIAVIAGLAACQKAISNHKAKQPLTDLAGSEWGPVDNPHDQFVGFKSGGEMVGSGGCNNFFGTYDLVDSEITIGPLASTKKFCADSMAAESDFLSRLQQARKVEATFKQLFLYDTDGNKVLSLQRRDWD